MKKEPSLNSLCELVNLRSKKTKYYNAVYDVNNNVTKIDKLIESSYEARLEEKSFISVSEARDYLLAIIDYQKTER